MNKLPKHVALIMDGNGRWAKQHNLPRSMGHQAGYKAAEAIVTAAAKKNIDTLSLFAFGCDNWSRPADEVSALLSLFSEAIAREGERFSTENLRLCFIGDLSKLDPEFEKQAKKIEQASSGNTGLRVVVALNYSGQWDILQATQNLAAQVKTGELTSAQIDEARFAQALSTADFPEPDLLIRTSGEARISNFMLWQCAYTEMYFCDKLWPDFNADDFDKALAFFSGRQRRFGLTSEQVTQG